MRRIITVAALGLAGATLTACGSPPEDASEKDFCKAYEGIYEQFMTDEVDADKMDKAIEKLEETGTPKGISEKEREGFELHVELFNDVDWDADEKDLEEEIEDIDDELDDDEEEALEAFSDYAEETCA